MATAEESPLNSVVWGGRYKPLQVLANHSRLLLVRCSDLLGKFGEVTVKVLRSASDHVTLENFRERGDEFLERALRVAEHLRGTDLELILDSGWDDATGLPYLVHPYLPGMDLQQWLSKHGRPELRQGVEWAAQIAEQISLAHARHVVHFDIKPQNVIITEPDHLAHVIDFGEALSAADTAENLYRTGVRGTRNYMAPEVLMGTVAGLDSAADVYSGGLLLLFLLTGQPPFHDRPRLTRVERETESLDISTGGRLIDRYLHPPDITDPAIPADLRDLYLRCVRLVPSDRPRAVDVARELRDWQSRRQPRSRFRLQPPLVALLSLGVVLAALSAALRQGKPGPEIETSIQQQFAEDAQTWPPPHRPLLLKENFDDPQSAEKRWLFQTPAITKVPLMADARIGAGRLTLTNRGLAALRTPIESSFWMEFDWMWVEGEGTYCDHLTVCLHSRCELNSQWPHEAIDGVSIKFIPSDGSIKVENRSSGRHLAIAAGMTMPRGVWHHIRIAEHEQEIVIYFDSLIRPALIASIDVPTTGRQFGFYSREPVGHVRKVSHIDNLSVWILEQND